MNLRPILPICFLFACLSLAACTGLGSPKQATPRRGFVTATPVPAPATVLPTVTVAPSATSTAEPQADTITPSPSASATTAPTETATSLPTPRPVVVVPPTRVVIDVDLSAPLAQDASGAQEDPAAFALAFLLDEPALHAVA